MKEGEGRTGERVWADIGCFRGEVIEVQMGTVATGDWAKRADLNSVLFGVML